VTKSNKPNSKKVGRKIKYKKKLENLALALVEKVEFGAWPFFSSTED
jgi:hypothetical protein